MPYNTLVTPIGRSDGLNNEANHLSPDVVQVSANRNKIAPNGNAQLNVHFECSKEILSLVTKTNRQRPARKIAIVAPNKDRQNEIDDFT
jgi:hypothetical protein